MDNFVQTTAVLCVLPLNQELELLLLQALGLLVLKGSDFSCTNLHFLLCFKH